MGRGAVVQSSGLGLRRIAMMITAAAPGAVEAAGAASGGPVATVMMMSGAG